MPPVPVPKPPSKSWVATPSTAVSEPAPSQYEVWVSEPTLGDREEGLWLVVSTTEANNAERTVVGVDVALCSNRVEGHYLLNCEVPDAGKWLVADVRHVLPLSRSLLKRPVLSWPAEGHPDIKDRFREILALDDFPVVDAVPRQGTVRETPYAYPAGGGATKSVAIGSCHDFGAAQPTILACRITSRPTHDDSNYVVKNIGSKASRIVGTALRSHEKDQLQPRVTAGLPSALSDAETKELHDALHELLGLWK